MRRGLIIFLLSFMCFVQMLDANVVKRVTYVEDGQVGILRSMDCKDFYTKSIKEVAIVRDMLTVPNKLPHFRSLFKSLMSAIEAIYNESFAYPNIETVLESSIKAAIALNWWLHRFTYPNLMQKVIDGVHDFAKEIKLDESKVSLILDQKILVVCDGKVKVKFKLGESNIIFVTQEYDFSDVPGNSKKISFFMQNPIPGLFTIVDQGVQVAEAKKLLVAAGEAVKENEKLYIAYISMLRRLELLLTEFSRYSRALEAKFKSTGELEEEHLDALFGVLAELEARFLDYATLIAKLKKIETLKTN